MPKPMPTKQVPLGCLAVKRKCAPSAPTGLPWPVSFKFSVIKTGAKLLGP